MLDRLFAGHCLFALYARARWSDAMLVKHLEVDGIIGAEAYVQAEVHERTKTSNLVNIKRAFLPLTAIGMGVRNYTWYNDWIAVREFWNLTLDGDRAMMPAPML
eukprot:2194528-Amphidinium_carterae.1